MSGIFFAQKKKKKKKKKPGKISPRHIVFIGGVVETIARYHPKSNNSKVTRSIW